MIQHKRDEMDVFLRNHINDFIWINDPCCIYNTLHFFQFYYMYVLSILEKFVFNLTSLELQESVNTISRFKS